MKIKDLECPEELSVEGIAAHEAVMALLKKHKATNTVGCKAFYSPKEWIERGEEYGRESVLIVCHDGGAHAPFFNLDYCEYGLYDEMVKTLYDAGIWVEQCTSWYSAIYT